MKNRCFLLAFFTITICFGQDIVETIDKENRKCLENTIPTTLGGVKCEKAALASWQKLMTETLQQLKAKSKHLSVASLEDSQKKWLAFQKADLAFYAAFYHKQYEGGTMTMAATARHEKQQFRERTLYLLEFLEMLQEE